MNKNIQRFILSLCTLAGASLGTGSFLYIIGICIFEADITIILTIDFWIPIIILNMVFFGVFFMLENGKLL